MHMATSIPYPFILHACMPAIPISSSYPSSIADIVTMHTARRYVSSSWIIEIQAKLSERALELLALPDNGVPRLFLDIGCGPGLYGDTLSEKRHQRIGLDISESGHTVASMCDVDSSLGDVGQGLGLRAGVIEGANSISAVQWVCNVDKSLHESR
ncbi:hypothetical protein PVL29_022715 [Vitis rotundifolia]|uniref:Methyltransferase type 11 domain-containing protein n=1 Tax=Vitis rotundifolia TaxID=103349 RepID=A0AA39DAI2_VITRO|nr:hypothetical protein PVL29_022715 [Vitis rotundifolia]